MTYRNNERKRKILQYDLLGEIYAVTARMVGRYSFPQLKEEKWIPGEAESFNYMLSERELEKKWIHCFCDDYQFERLWKGLPRYLPYILRAQGIISTDFSLYRDYDEDWLIWNCYRNRVLAYAMQEAGARVIPTAGFGGENTWSWCFDGLPRHSTVAITTNGTLSDPEARRLFVGGVDAMVQTIEPFAIVVCGAYPMWLDKKYPNISIIPIQSYGQIWRNRRKA